MAKTWWNQNIWLHVRQPNLSFFLIINFCNIIIITRKIYARGICTRRVPDPPPQVFQLRKIDALRSMHTAHFARLYIYIYIYNPSEIYIYIYFKKIYKGPPLWNYFGQKQGGGPFSYSGTEPRSGMIQVYWSRPRGKIGHMKIKIWTIK